MFLKRIKVQNFKSFRDLDLELGKFNVVIGANASGKSNFVEIFRFMKDLTKESLKNAISLRGGIEFFRNIKLNKDNSDFNFKGYHGIQVTDPYDRHEYLNEDFEYLLNLFFENGNTFIDNERISTNTKILDSIYENESNQEKVNLETRNCRLLGFKKSELLISDPQFSFSALPMLDLGKKLSLYNIDAKVAKYSSSAKGSLDLDEDGKNITLVLTEILNDNNKKKTLFNLLRDTLAFIKNIRSERISEDIITLKLQETYNIQKYLPSAFLSDGTINVIALIIALYFEQNSIVIFEEPDRNLHPSLISNIVGKMKDVAEYKNKQIIVTTHNPEFVKYAGIENLLLVFRDKDGYSIITRPAEKEAVRVFMQNDLGLDRLYIDNMLEVL